MIERERALSLISWAWVVAVFAAYVYQFRDLIGPVLGALGVSS